MTKPEIYFYISKKKYSDHWPKSLVDNWEAFAGGANVWSYLTPIALSEYGYPVQITTEIPDEALCSPNGALAHGVINSSTTRLETSVSGSRTYEPDRV